LSNVGKKCLPKLVNNVDDRWTILNTL